MHQSTPVTVSPNTGDGLNVVLFQKAVRVEAMEIPEGTEIEATTGHTSEDGWEADYSVTERVPPKKPPKEKEEEDQWPGLAAFAGGAWPDRDADLRDAALRIDIESIKVHVVRRVQFQCDAHDVRRHRWERAIPSSEVRVRGDADSSTTATAAGQR
jgi:hypothetical protein